MHSNTISILISIFQSVRTLKAIVMKSNKLFRKCGQGAALADLCLRSRTEMVYCGDGRDDGRDGKGVRGEEGGQGRERWMSGESAGQTLKAGEDLRG